MASSGVRRTQQARMMREARENLATKSRGEILGDSMQQVITANTASSPMSQAHRDRFKQIGNMAETRRRRR